MGVIIGVFLKGRGPACQMLLRSQVRLKGTFVEWPERHWRLRVKSLEGLLGWNWAELDGGVSSRWENWNCDCGGLSEKFGSDEEGEREGRSWRENGV